MAIDAKGGLPLATLCASRIIPIVAGLSQSVVFVRCADIVVGSVVVGSLVVVGSSATPYM